MEAEVALQVRFPTQSSRRGLGAGNFEARPSKASFRKMVSCKGRAIAEEKKSAQSHSLARQGAWLQWCQITEPFDFSWRNLIYDMSPHLSKFVIHAAVNWVKTPDLLALWGKIKSAVCPLCKYKTCSIHHILAGCVLSLNEKRYTWRHDSVLLAVESVLRPHVAKFNALRAPKIIPHITSSFVRAGANVPPRADNTQQASCLLDGASDWKILVDYDHRNVVFPPEIYATIERPDIIIWSLSVKKVFLIELTCPAEKGIQAARERKLDRYNGLAVAINASHWSATIIPFEVGARGFVAHSTHKLLAQLGIRGRDKSALCRKLGKIAARASFAIYLAHSNPEWDQNRVLLTSDD